MNPNQQLSTEVRLYALFQFVLMSVVWFGAQAALLIFGMFGALVVSSLLGVGMLISSRCLSAETKGLFRSPSYAYRRHLFSLSAIFVPIVSLLQIAIAAYFNTPLYWIISCIAIVIGGACVLHDWQVAKDLEKNMPNQSTDPTLASVTPTAVQPPRLP
jgi:hypothetical protein